MSIAPFSLVEHVHEEGKGGRAPREGKGPRGLHEDTVLLPCPLGQRNDRGVRR